MTREKALRLVAKTKANLTLIQRWLRAEPAADKPEPAQREKRVPVLNNLSHISKEPFPPEPEPFHWTKKYFEVGELVIWATPFHGKGQGLVTAVRRNHFGRISYKVEGAPITIQIEDIVATMTPPRRAER